MNETTEQKSPVSRAETIRRTDPREHMLEKGFGNGTWECAFWIKELVAAVVELNDNVLGVLERLERTQRDEH